MRDQIKFTNLDNGKQAVSYPIDMINKRIACRIWWKPSTWFNRVEYYTTIAITIPDEIESNAGDQIVVEYETTWEEME